MDIVILAAGTSSRMGKTNKMLLPYKGVPMVTHSCLQALAFLQDYSLEHDQTCNLIVVTGYRRRSAQKALEPCRQFIGQTNGRLGMLVVNNPDYRKGQFTSTKTGVAQITEGQPFFISLADMPLLTPAHYAKLVPLLEGHDAVRPFVQTQKDGATPGHPVLLAPVLRDAILCEGDDCTVSRILKRFNVLETMFQDPSWALDIDIPESYQDLIS